MSHLSEVILLTNRLSLVLNPQHLRPDHCKGLVIECVFTKSLGFIADYLNPHDYGVVQKVDHSGRTAAVQWMKTYTEGAEPWYISILKLESVK